MDRGRNLGVLAEEDSEEEEVDEGQKREGSSDDSDSDDEEPDPSSRREPNKFDNLCDGVTNTMAYVHGAMQELLNMKDEMLKHALPPTLLIKLATVTGKVFRSVSDLNMPVNELVRLVRVYSTPWEEKSAALKKLHEDYENKQRQLNIAVKRLQLVDAHSKRIAREKRIMNWEKLFAKIMSNKGHGRRWKFLIETIKQKAKLGLEHVQEYTRALEESSDEEEDEEDDMPMTIKRPGEDSDKLSDLEEGEEDDEKTSTGKEESGEDTEKSDKEEDSTRVGSPKKVRFASPEEPAAPVYVKPPTSDVEVWTGELEYDHFLYCRVYQPTKVEEQELKCVITLGEQIKKTKRIDVERPVSQPPPEKEEAKPKGRGLIGMRAKPAEDKMAQFKKEAEQRKAEQEAKTRYQEIFFEIPEYFGNDSVWRKGKENEPKSLKLSVHKGPTEDMFAMATIDLDDIFDQEMKVVYLPEPHGDDDVPPPPGENEKTEEEQNTTKPTTPKTDNGAPVEKHEILKKVEPLHFPIFALNPKKTDNVHEPCGNVPIVFYMAKRAKPKVWNRNNGTVPFNDFILDIAGIDLQTWRKEDMFKETESRAASAMEWQPEVQVKVVEKEVIKEVIVQAEPKIIEVPKTPPPPPPESPKEEGDEPINIETVPKKEYDKLINKHSEELQLVQAEYEKRLQELLENLQQMQQTQLEQKELLMQQQQQQQSRPQLVHQRPVSSSSKRSSASGGRVSAPPQKTPSQLQPSTMVSPSLGVSQEIAMLPKTPQTYDTLTPIGFESRTDNQSLSQSMPEPPSFSRKNPKLSRPQPPMGSDVPEDFLTRLAWFEETSKRHQQQNQERTMRTIQEELEKKLAGQHKLSRAEEGLHDAMRDVSLPALFMPTESKKATIYNPRAHQYFHPTGSSDLRLSQPPSVFQLPPLPQKSRMSVVNLFELSRNFNRKDQAWLMDKYIQQQEPLQNVHGTAPQTPAPTLTQTPYNDNPQGRDTTSAKERERPTEM
uniref:Titin-like isoform X3 n=1 Tax=Crassostrea virginica TaxID=6565 RepID=A0A8B8ANN4_CRAVI|nr:titin-like isoform X3 [Crassostrea virginica]